MQEYARKPEKSSSDSNSSSSGQPSASEILQAYKNGTLQRMSVDEEELLQAKARDKSSERETLQRYTEYTHKDRSGGNALIQGMFDTPQREVKPNNTGLPDNLKSGIENLSGYSLDDVKVHYNSDKPAQLSALAYAQGTDIHVAPGQERHLPHEAWHVVQQKQGRVQPTTQMQGVDVNDNEGLEKEADVMGEYGMNQSVQESKTITNNGSRSSFSKGFVDNRSRSMIQTQLTSYVQCQENKIKLMGTSFFTNNNTTAQMLRAPTAITPTNTTNNITINGANFQICTYGSLTVPANKMPKIGTGLDSKVAFGGHLKDKKSGCNATRLHVVNMLWGGKGGNSDGNIHPGSKSLNGHHKKQENVFKRLLDDASKDGVDLQYECWFSGMPSNIKIGDQINDPKIEVQITEGGIAGSKEEVERGDDMVCV